MWYIDWRGGRKWMSGLEVCHKDYHQISNNFVFIIIAISRLFWGILENLRQAIQDVKGILPFWIKFRKYYWIAATKWLNLMIVFRCSNILKIYFKIYWLNSSNLNNLRSWCERWANSGMCTQPIFQDYMKSKCAKSCQLC